jgi:hypothetical protein
LSLRAFPSGLELSDTDHRTEVCVDIHPYIYRV